MTFRDRLERAMKEAGIGPTELARRVGVSQATISQLKLGTSRGPRPENLIKIARVLSVRPEWLATGEEPMRPAPTADDLDETEKEVLNTLRSLSPKDRDLLLRIIRCFAERK